MATYRVEEALGRARLVAGIDPVFRELLRGAHARRANRREPHSRSDEVNHCRDVGRHCVPARAAHGGHGLALLVLVDVVLSVEQAGSGRDADVCRDEVPTR